MGTILVISNFANVLSEHPDTASQAQLSTTLVYINLFGSFIGKQLVLIPWLPIRGKYSLLAFIFIINLYTFFFSFYYLRVFTFISDIMIYITAALYCILAGYASTLVFTLVQKEVSSKEKSLAGTILNIFYKSGVIVAIVISILVNLLVFNPSKQHALVTNATIPDFRDTNDFFDPPITHPPYSGFGSPPVSPLPSPTP